MSTMTKRDAVEAAMSVADDVAEGRLSPDDLERQAVEELRQLVGEVVGPGDPIWPLQCEIASQAVALGAIEPNTLREWATVIDRQRGVVPLEPATPPIPLSEVESAAVDELNPDSDAEEDHDGHP